MNKAVLLSVQPRWCENICHQISVNADGSPIYEKGVEVRKTRPKLKTPFKVYIYCTLQGSNEFFQSLKNSLGEYEALSKWNRENWGIKKGKVIGEFVCDEIYPIKVHSNCAVQNWNWFGLSRSCLSLEEVAKYIGANKTGYGWHISDLVIYDKPKELSEFRIECKGGCDIPYLYDRPCANCNKNRLTRPPQSWCYVEELSA